MEPLESAENLPISAATFDLAVEVTFFNLTAKAYEIIRMIPPGHVTSYGHIARLAGYPKYSRHVGNALRDLPAGSTIPWFRVISSTGQISPRGDAGQAVARQKAALEQDGIEVETMRGTGGQRVDMRRYGWFPDAVDLG